MKVMYYELSLEWWVMVRMGLGYNYSNYDVIIIVTLTLCEILLEHIQSIYGWISVVGISSFY